MFFLLNSRSSAVVYYPGIQPARSTQAAPGTLVVCSSFTVLANLPGRVSPSISLAIKPRVLVSGQIILTGYEPKVDYFLEHILNIET